MAGLLGGCWIGSRLIEGEGGDSGREGAGWLAAAAFPVLVTLDIKTTAFAMSGQEAGLMILFLAAAFALAYRGWVRPVAGGFAWAGLMYTRPDGCVYVAITAALALAFGREPWPARWRTVFRSAAVCALLYAPWFAVTWGYFGSPVPHTVVAKFGMKAFQSDWVSLTTPLFAVLSVGPSLLCLALGPIYDPLVSGPTAWPKGLHDAVAVLEVLALAYWVWPKGDRLGRMASGAAFLVFLYLAYAGSVAAFEPWYLPPLSYLIVLAWAGMVRGLVARPVGPRRWVGAAAGVVALCGLGATLAYVFVLSTPVLAIKQRVIEWGERREIGLWLKANVPAGDSVYLEPLGYIGYYSGRRMADWPGLVSPEVVAIRRRLPGGGGYDSWAAVAETLQPAWIVARAEEARMLRASPYLWQHYRLAKMFDVRPELRTIGPRRGISLLYPDAVYFIFRRGDAPVASGR